MIKSGDLTKIQNLLRMVKSAEDARLARALSEIADCKFRAAQFRREMRVPYQSLPPSNIFSAADMVSVSQWVLRLAERAEAVDAQVIALELAAAAIRNRLLRTYGRESAAAAMLNQVCCDERKSNARRAEEAIFTPNITPSAQ